MPTLNIGMLGCGNVGAEVARLLSSDSGDFAARAEQNLYSRKLQSAI